MTTRNILVTTKPSSSNIYVLENSPRLRALLLGNRFAPGLLRQLLVYGLLTLLAVLFLVPFYWMVNTALKPVEQVFF